MRRALFAGIVAMFTVVLVAPPATVAEADRPLNDDIGQAETITYPFTTTPVEISVDNSAATPEAGEPHPCGGSDRTVWYKIPVPSGAPFGVLLVEDNGTPGDNLRVAAGRIQAGVFSVLGCGGGSWATTQLSPGATAYVQVMDDGTGGGQLRLRLSILPPPANDFFHNAQEITVFSANTSVDNRAATRQAWPAPPTLEPLYCGASTRTVWYRFIAPGAGRVTVTPDLAVLADPALQEWRQTGDAVSTLVPGTCSTLGPLAFDVQAGMTYYVQAADVAQTDVGLETRGGTLSLRFDFQAAPDTTAPVLVLPAEMVVQATGPAGSIVTFTASAEDEVDGAVAVTCNPASGSTFSVGATTVLCSATDAAGNAAFGSFEVRVVDTEAAALTGYDILGTAASGFGCWSFDYTGTMTDTGRRVGGSVMCGDTGGWIADYAGGSGPLNDGIVARSQLFTNRNDLSGAPIDPVIVLHLAQPMKVDTIELIGDNGTGYSWAAGFVTQVTVEIGGETAVVAPAGFGPLNFGIPSNDRIDLSGTSLSGVATTTVTLTHFKTAWTWGEMDQWSLTEIRVLGVTVEDTTPPEVTVPADMTEEATGQTGAEVTFVASATDNVDGPLTPTCTPASGGTFALGATLVTCTATDAAGNTGSASFTITVEDTTPPEVTWSDHAAVYDQADQVVITCTATDEVAVDSDTCQNLDSPAWMFSVGLNEYTAQAWDAAGNMGEATTSFTTVVTYAGMQTLTTNWVYKDGIRAQLLTYLVKAELAQERGNQKAEASILSDYRSLLRAQAGKAIDEYYMNILWDRSWLL